jgi:hypothetical protein
MGEEALQPQQEKETSTPAARPKVSCVPKADALWFCYCKSFLSPAHASQFNRI